jgi:hypothetical protein
VEVGPDVDRLESLQNSVETEKHRDPSTLDSVRRAMAAVSKIGEHQYKAFIDRISHSMVFTLHHAPGCNPSVGTGVLVHVGERVYIVSALHNFTVAGDGSPEIIQTWNETRFKFRDGGVLNFREHLNLPEEELLLRPGVQLSTGRPPLIDRRFDLIAVRLEPREVISNDVYSIDAKERIYSGEIKAGASLITVGMPYAGGVKLSDGTTVFYPHTDHVRHDPHIDASNMPHSYAPEDHLLYKYSNHLDGIDPGGYSGAPVWSNYEVDETAVWSAKPVIVGIALDYYRRRKLLQAVRIKHLMNLFEADTSATAFRRPATA